MDVVTLQYLSVETHIIHEPQVAFELTFAHLPPLLLTSTARGFCAEILTLSWRGHTIGFTSYCSWSDPIGKAAWCLIAIFVPGRFLVVEPAGRNHRRVYGAIERGLVGMAMSSTPRVEMRDRVGEIAPGRGSTTRGSES
jgi:hypothetical protein